MMACNWHSSLYTHSFEAQPNSNIKNDIRDVGSTADLVLVFLVHPVHWYLVHWYTLVPPGTCCYRLVPAGTIGPVGTRWLRLVKVD